MFNFEKDLSADATITRADKSRLQAITAQEQISDKLFQNKTLVQLILNLFLKRFNSLYKSFLCSLNLILNINLYDGTLMFPLTFPVTCGVCTRNQK